MDLAGRLETRELEEGMQLALATQDCDLVKPSDRFPDVEAIGCVTSPDLASTVMANSAQYFVLDPVEGLVADASVSIPIAKEALLGLSAPAPACGGDERRARRLAPWLGARFDRTPLPDGAVEAIQRPLAAAVKKLCKPGKRHASLNEVLHEIRVVGGLDGGPPYVISLLFVLESGTAPEAHELAIAELIAEAGFAVEDTASAEELAEANVHIRNYHVLPPSLLSVEAYYSSTPLALDHFSLAGEETVGAEPLDAESA
jgi:hypothetical protein